MEHRGIGTDFGSSTAFERQFEDNFRLEELGVIPKLSIHWGDGDSNSDTISRLTAKRVDALTEKILKDIAARFDDHFQFDPHGLFDQYGLKGLGRKREQVASGTGNNGGYDAGGGVTGAGSGANGGYDAGGGGSGGGSSGGYESGGGGGGSGGAYESGGTAGADASTAPSSDATAGGDQLVGPVPEGERKELIDQALKLAGVPVTPENEAAVNLIIQHESEWVVGAQNNWDENATVRGTPSKGLMQVIEPTFLDNAIEGFNTNIFDPLSNLIAGIRYAVKRYGSLQQTPGVASVAQGGGYLPY
jgi:hypothetical protein